MARSPRPIAQWFAALSLVLTSSQAIPAAQATVERIQPNDNQRNAGTTSGTVTTINLVAREGQWFPDGPSSIGIPIQAFGEGEGPLTVPGPLVRVPSGSELVVSVRNDIPGTTLSVHGLYTRPAGTDTVLQVPAGETRTARFVAGEAGTYFYWASTGGRTFAQRNGVDSQLGGAFIVDTPGTRPNDRVLVLGEWLDPRAAAGTADWRAYTINGLAWPNTERFEARVGDTFEWRWVNPTVGGHPLHLHGAYYRVLATGTLLADTPYAETDARTVVTELVPSGRTMRMAITPERPGNWLFHCHIAAHVSPEYRGPSAPTGAGEHNHAEEGMGGMVLGVRVFGDDPAAPNTTQTRRLTMSLDRMASYFGVGNDGIGVSFKEGNAAAPLPMVPGPPLVVTRDQPLAITIENHLREATAIHWHGMELDSYFDGVPGFSGTAGSVTPVIPPGGSFEARFTPPRSGTFIYHTHSSDAEQLAAGLYGALIVMDDQASFDAQADTVVLLGLYGSVTPDRLSVNGNRTPEFTLKAGVPHRFRLINITANNAGFNVTLTSPASAVEWKPMAKDGADLPLPQQAPQAADRQPLSVGETRDFEWRPPAAGVYWLEVRRGGGEWMGQTRVVVTR